MLDILTKHHGWTFNEHCRANTQNSGHNDQLLFQIEVCNEKKELMIQEKVFCASKTEGRIKATLLSLNQMLGTPDKLWSAVC